MKKAINLTLFFIISICNFYNCNSQENLSNTNDSVKTRSIDINKINLLKSTYKLDNHKIARLIKNDSIAEELFLSIKDSIKVNNIKKRLDSFFLGKYDNKKLLAALRLERLLSGGTFEFSDSINPKKALHFKNIEEFNKFMLEFDENLNKSSTVVKSKDTIKKKKQ